MISYWEMLIRHFKVGNKLQLSDPKPNSFFHYILLMYPTRLRKVITKKTALRIEVEELMF